MPAASRNSCGDCPSDRRPLKGEESRHGSGARSVQTQTQTLISRLVAWLQEQAAVAGARGAVVGVSGGVDSAVVLGLCARAFPASTLGLILPCASLAEDIEHARAVAATFGVPTLQVDLQPAYTALLQAMGEEIEAMPDDATGRLIRANLKPRLRMAVCYYHAARRGYLVVGTGNQSELTVGYFTKYGDGGVDLLPLGALVKAEVQAIARALGVPAAISTKPPSAGLWAGQTDEEELGFTYAELDRYIRTGSGPTEVVEQIRRREAASAHKRNPPPIFEP